MKKIFSIIAVLLAAAGMTAAGLPPVLQAHADGFGITPPYVTNAQLTQNSHYEQVITLVRSDPTEDLQTNVTINVPGADSWISIDRGTQFIMPAGTQQEPMTVSVNVPSDAKLGSYTGNIQVVVSPLGGPAKGTVGITIGAQIDVSLQVVSGKMANLSVKRVTMTNTEVGHTLWWMHFPGKILFAMDLDNTGNIAGTPGKVVFQYQEYLTGNVLETEQNTNGLDSVQPFEAKTVTAEMPTYLPQGSYRVFYQIYGADSANVIGQGTLDLAILPPGTLLGYVGYGFWGLRWSEKFMTFGVIILILALLYLIFWGARKMAGKWRHRGRGRTMPPPPPPDYR
jgi:methionine-rich copper-binding protein CopC